MKKKKGYSSFLHQSNWLPQYNWNIPESGSKHPNPITSDSVYTAFISFFLLFFYLRPSLLSLCILTAPILSLSVSSDRGSWNHIALTIKHIKIFSINFTLSRILTADNLNDLRVKFLYWVQKPVGHFVFFASSKTFSLLTSISSKLEWIFPKKKKITNQLL
jgi:hypothetical protein